MYSPRKPLPSSLNDLTVVIQVDISFVHVPFKIHFLEMPLLHVTGCYIFACIIKCIEMTENHEILSTAHTINIQNFDNQIVTKSAQNVMD